MPHILQRMSSSVREGHPFGLYSVCSAHPLVLKAAILQALQDKTPLLVEATSNQVNQFGGYSGMRPADFRDFVCRLADQQGYAREHVILGGDHLGPNTWTHLSAEEAMQYAEEMVAEYSRAGFAKIHLDASMACSGDQHPLPDRVVAERAARLCRAAEDASGGSPRFYVIGTEVPVPGGATEGLAELEVTPYARAAQTLAIHHEVFSRAGLSTMWPRVIAMVVQPGVEFNHDSVADYVSAKTGELQQLLRDVDGLVFEAHSTDYQRPSAFTELVNDGFTILKVGPALTFALREGLFALERIEQELFPVKKCSGLSSIIDHEMLAYPEHWAKHYHGTLEQQRLLRRYSYSDRIRYYWGNAAVQAAVDKLMSNLNSVAIPETLLSAVLPVQYQAVRQEGLPITPEALIIAKIQQALSPYAAAGICRLMDSVPQRT
ncbi:MAG TPA: D-tagatose-bisphosphate aldolase, class II, non-catalytic subunit [Acidobacteriaceae bacterium]